MKLKLVLWENKIDKPLVVLPGKKRKDYNKIKKKEEML